jgi:hypothetical protein
VEHRGLEYGDVLASAHGRDERRDLDGMIDVRRLVVSLAPLVAMLARGKGKSVKKGNE